MKKTKFIMVRVTPEFKAKIQKLADKKGTTISEIALSALKAKIAR